MGVQNHRALVPWAVGAVALIAGFLLGRMGDDSKGGGWRSSGAAQRQSSADGRKSPQGRGSGPSAPTARASTGTASADDAGSKLKNIMQEAPSFERDLALAQFVSKIPREQLLDVLNSLQGQTDVIRGAMASHLVASRLAAEDPGGAMAWLKSRPQGVDGYIGISTLFSVWSGRDLGQALANAAELVDPRQRQQANSTILTSVAQRDPLKALELLEKNPLLSRNGQGENSVYSAWAAKDPLGAAQSALEVPAGVRRQKAIGGIIEGWAARDPAAAWSWAKSLTSPRIK